MRRIHKGALRGHFATKAKSKLTTISCRIKVAATVFAATAVAISDMGILNRLCCAANEVMKITFGRRTSRQSRWYVVSHIQRKARNALLNFFCGNSSSVSSGIVMEAEVLEAACEGISWSPTVPLDEIESCVVIVVEIAW